MHAPQKLPRWWTPSRWFSHEKKHPLEWATFLMLLGTLVATGFAANYTRKQWLSAEDTERRTLRAYIALSNSQQPSPLNVDNTKTTFWLDNFGQTPAKNVQVWGNWEFVPFGEDLPADFDFRVKPPTPCTQMPGQNIARGPITVFPKNALQLALYHCQTLLFDFAFTNQKQSNAFLYGYISYLDIFNIEHRTNYCMLYYPAIRWTVLCGRHNEIDPDE
jgi:hypothetical protein